MKLPLVLCLKLSMLPFADSLFGSFLLFKDSSDPIVAEHDPDVAGERGSYDVKLPELQQLEDLQLHKLSLSVHRNGEAIPCGVVNANSVVLANTLAQMDLDAMNKFDMEAFLTNFLFTELNLGECGSKDDTSRAASFAGYCDMGPERTVVQYDHEQLRRIGSDSTLPCRFYTREGLRVDSIERLQGLAATAKEQADCFVNHLGLEECSTPAVDLYAVPAGRVFMFAPKHVGEKFVIDHVEDAVGERFVMEVVSLEPRVFELFNFFTLEEAEQLIERALSETDELFKLQRSTINGGLRGGKVVSKRTSENSWDVYSEVAIRMKRRCLEFLGFDVYEEAYSDGLQIARYAETQGFASHPDYMNVDTNGIHNYDTSNVGSNRFATIVMYLTDLRENDGGETVFENAPQPATLDQMSQSDVVRKLRSSGQINALQPGSWEEELTALCKTRLTVHPKAGRAIMFYSQHPNGDQDLSAINGACPVLNGTKWDATLWGWSGPRPEYPGAPQNEKQGWW